MSQLKATFVNQTNISTTVQPMAMDAVVDDGKPIDRPRTERLAATNRAVGSAVGCLLNDLRQIIADYAEIVDVTWTAADGFRLSNGGKTVYNPLSTVRSTVMYASTPMAVHPAFEIRLTVMSLRSFSYFSIASLPPAKSDADVETDAIGSDSKLFTGGIGIGRKDHPRIMMFDVSTLNGRLAARWPPTDGTKHMMLEQQTDWPTDRLRFSADLATGLIRVMAFRTAAIDSKPELVCTLFMEPERLAVARPVCMIVAGQTVDIRAVDD